MFGLSSLYSGLLLAHCVWSQSEEQLQREVESPLNCVDSERSQNGDTILVTYTGYLANGTKFDSNEGGDPLSFVLGEGRVIQGWEQGLVNTCAGEKVFMIIPPSLGYGSLGVGGVIPGGATLYFIATLNGIVRKTKEAPEVKQDGKCNDLKTIKAGDRVVMRSRITIDAGRITIKATTPTIGGSNTFHVGRGQVVKGWDIGVLGACEGEERRIVLGPSLAIGGMARKGGWRGLPREVDGDATIVIDVAIERVERVPVPVSKCGPGYVWLGDCIRLSDFYSPQRFRDLFSPQSLNKETTGKSNTWFKPQRDIGRSLEMVKETA